MNSKTIQIAVLLFVTHVILFIAGSTFGKHVTQTYYEHEFEVANAAILLSHYSTYRDIALGIREAQYDAARCRSELNATAMLAGLEICLNDSSCKPSLEKKANEFAPEVLGNVPIPLEKRVSCP